MIQTRHMSFFFLVKLDKSIGQVDKKKTNKPTKKQTKQSVCLALSLKYRWLRTVSGKQTGLARKALFS